jgi:hypothetical protein
LQQNLHSPTLGPSEYQQNIIHEYQHADSKDFTAYILC